MSEAEAVKFVYREARLLDEKRFDEWYELFTEDAYYWVPLVPGQTDPLAHNSLAYEDKLLLKLRIEISLVPLQVISPCSPGRKLRCRLTHSLPSAARPSCAER